VSDQLISFQLLRRDDFPLLSRWLSEPLVARWWAQDTSADALEREFGVAIDGGEPTEIFLAHKADRPFGLIQRYPIAAYDEYIQELSAVCPLPPGAWSIDYLIGEPDCRGLGLGSQMIGAFIKETWKVRPAALCIVVPVHAENGRSWRALEHAGLRRIAEGEMTPDNPRDSRAHYIYAIMRPDSSG
jgi:aminoglycoside 6'-N-acetyltransferase